MINPFPEPPFRARYKNLTDFTISQDSINPNVSSL